MKHLKQCIHLIGGFTQSEYGSIGLSSLASKLTHLASPTSVILLRAWNTPWRSYAQMIERDCGDECRHFVVGYSYGAGHGVKRLAEELNDRALRIDELFLIDPVIRWTWMLPLKLLSLTRLGKFTCPANVDRCWSFRQVNNRPPGRAVIGAVGVVQPEVVFGSTANLVQYVQRYHTQYHPLTHGGDRFHDEAMTHAAIDNSPTVHTAIVRGIESALSQPRIDRARGDAPTQPNH